LSRYKSSNVENKKRESIEVGYEEERVKKPRINEDKQRKRKK